MDLGALNGPDLECWRGRRIHGIPTAATAAQVAPAMKI
jgi:hypothetical protein